MQDNKEPKANWEELWPEAAELCEKGLERLSEHGDLDNEGLEMLKRSANLGYPWGQYKYAISCYYHLDDPQTAFRHFKKAAAAGHLDSLYHLGLLYQKGLASPSRLSKDPCVAELQVQREAAKCYKSAAAGGHWTAQLNLGMMYLNGIGFGRNYHKAFKLIFASACQNYPPAMAQLARLYLDECKAGDNPVEAYIWALLEANGEGSKIAEEIEPLLDPATIHAAQSEAERRQDILLEKGILREEDIKPFAAKKEETQAFHKPESFKIYRPVINGKIAGEYPSPTGQKSAHRSGISLADWNLACFKDLKLTLYLVEKTITLSYRKHKLTKPADALFSPTSLRLLIMYFDQAHQGSSPLGYHDRTIGGMVNSELPNHRIVTYFNCDIRKLFSLDKKARAFEWIGSKYGKSLKSNFELVVK